MSFHSPLLLSTNRIPNVQIEINISQDRVSKTMDKTDTDSAAIYYCTITGTYTVTVTCNDLNGVNFKTVKIVVDNVTQVNETVNSKNYSKTCTTYKYGYGRADGSSTSATNQATSSFNKQSVNVSVTVTTNNGEITETGSLKCSY